MRSRDLGRGDASAEISTTVYSCHCGGVVALCHTVKRHFVCLEVAGTLSVTPTYYAVILLFVWNKLKHRPGLCGAIRVAYNALVQDRKNDF
jgi:hypothetical protein